MTELCGWALPAGSTGWTPRPAASSTIGTILATAQSINNTLTTIRNTQSSVILTDVVNIKADTTSIITNVHTIDANLCHANYGVALGILSSGHGGDPGCNNNTIHPLA